MSNVNASVKTPAPTNRKNNVRTTSAGYYNKKNLDKFFDALNDAREAFTAGRLDTVHFSTGNKKMGEIPSVSLIPFYTCPGHCHRTCGPKCYAAKVAALRPNVLKTYAENTILAIEAPALFWRQVRARMMTTRFFRFHVSGDVINSAYFGQLVNACKENPHCETLVFTKRYSIVNAWIDENGALPANLHLLFSGWDGLQPENPHNLPETNVFGDDVPARPEWLICGGNCFDCICAGLGCWKAAAGDTVAFHIH